MFVLTILVSVNLIDINMCEVIAWIVLLLCLMTFKCLHTVQEQQNERTGMVWISYTKYFDKYSWEVVREKLWKFVSIYICKSYSEKNRGSFLCGHGVDYRGTEVLLDFTSVASFPNEVKLRPNSVLLTVSPTAKIMGDSGEMPESMFRARHICRTQLLIYVLTPLCGLGDLTSGKNTRQQQNRRPLTYIRRPNYMKGERSRSMSMSLRLVLWTLLLSVI